MVDLLIYIFMIYILWGLAGTCFSVGFIPRHWQNLILHSYFSQEQTSKWMWNIETIVEPPIRFPQSK